LLHHHLVKQGGEEAQGEEEERSEEEKEWQEKWEAVWKKPWHDALQMAWSEVEEVPPREEIFLPLGNESTSRMSAWWRIEMSEPDDYGFDVRSVVRSSIENTSRRTPRSALPAQVI
jgi:hypothetical protein